MKIKSILTSAAIAAFSIAGTANAASFSFTNNSGEGSIGNNVAQSNGGVTVTVTAFTYTSGSVSSRGVGQYSGGLGVNNTSGSTDYNFPNHAVDNNGGIDMLLFSFSTGVNLSTLGIGYTYNSNEADFRYWTSTSAVTAASLFGTGTGGTAVNGILGTNPVAGSNVRTLLVAADPNGGYNDYFKVNALTTSSNIPGTPDAGSTVALLGIALAGLAFAKRRLAA